MGGAGDVDGVGLEAAEEEAGWNEGGFEHLVNDGLGVGVGGDDGEGPVVMDEAELAGGGAEVVGERFGKKREDAVFIEGVGSEVEKSVFEVVFDDFWRKKGRKIAGKGFGSDLGGLFDVIWLVFGQKDDGFTVFGPFSFAVAASGGLGDGVESGEGAIDDGEVEVHACFDEGGADDKNGLFFVFQARFDGFEG